MAATISAFKGFRTILTTIDKKRNTTSSKYARLLAEYTKLPKKTQGGDSQDAHTPLKYSIAEIKNCISDYSKRITSNIMKEYLQYVINLTDKSSLLDDLYSNICEIIKHNTLTSSQKNISIANYINNIFENNDEEEEMDYFIKSPVGAIYMEYLLNTPDINTLYKDIRNLERLKYLTRDDIKQMIMIGKTNRIHPIILNFLNDIKNPNILINNLQILRNNIPPGSELTPFGPILENQQHPRTVLRDLYNRTLKDHVTYMNINIPIKQSSVSGRTKRSSLKTNSYTNYTYNSTEPEDLYNFMKLPFQVKHMIIQYSTDKEKIIKHVFDTFYKSGNFNIEEIDKEIAVIEHCKKILKVPLEQPIKSSDTAFLLFREILYFQPEYIDPFMLIYMTYSNSLVPPNIAFQSIPINTPTPQSRPQSTPQSRQTPTPQSTPQSSPVPVTRKAANNSVRRQLNVAGGKKK
jgi:hypothetical protein